MTSQAIGAVRDEAPAAAGASSVLAVEGLTIRVADQDGDREVVSDIGFQLGRGETLCLAGESGSGKSMTALAIMGLLPQPAARLAAGRVTLAGCELVTTDERRMRQIRGDRIAMIFQEPMTSLNPVLSIGRQLIEAIQAHTSLARPEARRLALEALSAVRIPDADRRLAQFPHELSGGMRQRVMIAMALALKPDVLIADEPTTALDVTVQGEVLELLRDLQRSQGTSVLLITHDMGVVAEMADRVAVMRHGRIVEAAPVGPLFGRPRADYTRELLAAVPRLAAGARAILATAKPQPVVAVRDLTVRFDLRGGFFGRISRRVHAVEAVSFDIRANETFALVGESGCGKSTTAKAIAGLVPYSGEIRIGGRDDLAGLARPDRQSVRREVQMIFQDPFASLDPRMRAGDLVAEPLLVHGLGTPKERKAEVALLFDRVGLGGDKVDRYPHEFSGGQRQRICIARALALRPKLIIADESLSALDVSVQARVIALLKDLQKEFGVAYLFISHDMAVVANVSQRVAVMYLGQIVEMGPADEVFSRPRHPYTRRLIESVPVADPAQRRSSFARLAREIPSVIRRPGEAPERVALIDLGGDHWVAETAVAAEQQY